MDSQPLERSGISKFGRKLMLIAVTRHIRRLYTGTCHQCQVSDCYPNVGTYLEADCSLFLVPCTSRFLT